ncbi:hypothetical protein CGGC5_v008867 [Colletotrichum fructicola Nara gc5]|uniref:Uncharacterized protein n=1 Tax=Colletotrichum fructicola (strain Nara gc5) TaxID=1213859 RepID=A0A7J6IZA6_COLFN|nr:hypothetical protein CGGC5_v008867 [Colletotrichum fructicola Nara gc5]
MSLDSSTIILHHGPRNVCRIRTLLALSLTSSSQSSSKPSSLRATRTSLSLLLKCHMNQNEYNCFDDLCLRVEHSGLASRGRSYRAPRRGMEDLSLKFSGQARTSRPDQVSDEIKSLLLDGEIVIPCFSEWVEFSLAQGC